MAHRSIDSYATLIDAKTYAVLRHISFKGAGGLEQPFVGRESRRILDHRARFDGWQSDNRSNRPAKLPLTVDKATVLCCKALAGTVSSSITGIATRTLRTSPRVGVWLPNRRQRADRREQRHHCQRRGWR